MRSSTTCEILEMMNKLYLFNTKHVLVTDLKTKVTEVRTEWTSEYAKKCYEECSEMLIQIDQYLKDNIKWR